MHHTSHFRSAHRPLRASALLALLLLLGLVGLRPPSVALAACGGAATVVGTTAELNAAITAFNDLEASCAFTIQLSGDITLDDDLDGIGNETPGVTLTIDGAGYTIDGGGTYYNIFYFDDAVATIHNLTMADTTQYVIEGYYNNLTLWKTTIRGAQSDGINLIGSDLTVVDSTLYHNRGSGVMVTGGDNPGSVTLVNTTITGNGDGEDSGFAVDVDNMPNVRLTHVTLVDNNGGLFVENVPNVIVNNSILALNGSDCQNWEGSSVVDFNHSLVQFDDIDYPCGVADDIDGNFKEHNPMLMPLGDYGGPTLTMPPMAIGGAPVNFVIDTGSNALSVDHLNNTLAFDQRGQDRISNGLVDMGAVEGGVLIDCTSPFPMTAANVHELNLAIACFGFINESGDYRIDLMDEIDLTAMTFPIKNQTPGVALTIDGHNYAIEGLSALHTRPLAIAPLTNVTIQNTTITRGNAPDGILGRGGGIYNEGYLVLIQSIVSESTAGEKGGGIYNALGGELTLVESEIYGNSSGYMGGGIANEGILNIIDSAISNNEAVHEEFAKGGGISNEGEMKLTRSIVDYNSAQGSIEAYGGGIANEGLLTVFGATIASNVAEAEVAIGGGIFSQVEDGEDIEVDFGAELKISNSTISSNSAVGTVAAGGGGLFVGDMLMDDPLVDPVPVWLINSTVTANSLVTTGDFAGSGVMLLLFDFSGVGISANFSNSILAGNTLNGAAEFDCQVLGNDGLDFVSFASLYGDIDEGACGLPADADGDGNGNLVGVAANLGPLVDNGGPYPTHIPLPGSPAIDSGRNDLADDEEGDPLTADQRGYEPRIVNGTVDMGSVEVGAQPPVSGPAIYMTATASGKTADGLSFDNSDILKFDGAGGWSLYFDGSVALQAAKKSKHNINAFWLDDDEIIMSFVKNNSKVPGITPKVDGTDLVRWDGSAFSLWFDGSDVELNKKGPERVDGLHVLPGDAVAGLFGEGTCVAYLMVSFQGPGAVTAYGGGPLKFGGEDVLGFCATSLGDDTAGHWHMLFDGSVEGVKKNAIDSIGFSADGQTLYVMTKGKFKLDDANGGHSSIYYFNLPTGEFTGPVFVAPEAGLPKKVNGMHMD